jgi:integrase
LPTRIVEAQWLKEQKRWQIKVQANGVRRAFTSSIPGRAGKAEANRKADEWLANSLVDPSSPVSVVWEKWFATLTSEVTERQAKSFWKNHIGIIGKKKIGELNAGDLQAVIDKAAKKGLSKKTLAVIRSIMHSFVKWSRKNKYTILTTEDVSIPKNAPTRGKKILQPDDLRRLFACEERLYSNLFKFAALTGLRPGELIGLMWEDISLNYMFIRRSINFQNKLTQGKNENAKRKIVLGKHEKKVLADQREALKRRGLISPWVFPGKDGSHAVQENVAESWEAFCKAEGITPGVTPYGWRHTFVSVTYTMPDGLKKHRIGHSKNMDTEGVYGKRVNGDDAAEAAYIESRFDEILNRMS